MRCCLALGAGALDRRSAGRCRLPLNVVESCSAARSSSCLAPSGSGVSWPGVYGHSHRHASEPAAHWHLHFGRQDHHPAASAHSHLPTILGAAFAISSLRALTLLAPFGDRLSASPLSTLLLLDRRFWRRHPALDVALRRRLARVMSAADAARSAAPPRSSWPAPRSRSGLSGYRSRVPKVQKVLLNLGTLKLPNPWLFTKK